MPRLKALEFLTGITPQIPTQENQETINVVDPLKYYQRMQVQEWLLNREYERQQNNESGLNWNHIDPKYCGVFSGYLEGLL